MCCSGVGCVNHRVERVLLGTPHNCLCMHAIWHAMGTAQGSSTWHQPQGQCPALACLHWPCIGLLALGCLLLLLSAMPHASVCVSFLACIGRSRATRLVTTVFICSGTWPSVCLRCVLSGAIALCPSTARWHAAKTLVCGRKKGPRVWYGSGGGGCEEASTSISNNSIGIAYVFVWLQACDLATLRPSDLG